MLWPSRHTTHLFNVKRKGPTPLSTKIILFSYEEEIYCLCFFSASTTSLQMSPTSMQSRGMRQDSQNSGGEGREGDLNFPCTRHDCAHRVEVQVPSLLLPDIPSALSAWTRHPSFMVLPYSHVKYLQDLLHYLTGYNYCRGELGPTHLNIILCSYFFSSISRRPISM